MKLATAIVIAKEPMPGRVKTRLVPPLTYDDAASLAAAAIADTLHEVEALGARHKLLAFDGRASRWRPRGWHSVPQPDGSLDVRLAAAFAAAPPGPAVLVGMDTPQLRAEQLACFDPSRFDACLGPAVDGGYWAIGLRDPEIAAAVFGGIPMSRADTGARQLDRLVALGLRVQLLDELTDVDLIESAVQVAAIAPSTAFAAEMRRTPLLAGTG